MTAEPTSGTLWGPRTSFDRVRSAIEAMGLRVDASRPTHFKAQCPVHDDRTPSMQVSWKSGQRGGYTLLWCHSCQEHAPGDRIAEALGLSVSDLFDEPMPERDRNFVRSSKSTGRRQSGKRRGKLGRLPTRIARPDRVTQDEFQHEWSELERYPYVDHDERLIQEVIREECRCDGTRHKQFRQLFVTREGRRVKRRPQSFYPVLYRAPQVKAAVEAGNPVWILEGEKDVHTAEACGQVATTNTQGGKSFPDDLIDDLQGAHVVVVLDRDATGWARGVDLHAKLSGVGATVDLRLPAVEDAKADFTDHVEAGHPLSELVRVTVDEVETWHRLESVRHSVDRLTIAVDEAYARFERAQAGEDTDSNQRFAERWATETQIRQEELREAVHNTFSVGLRVGTEWVGQALDAADTILDEATQTARRCHHDIGVAVPPSLRDNPDPTDQGGTSTSSASPTDITSDTRQDWVGDRGADANAPVFRVLDGRIVQWEPKKSSSRRNDDEDDESGSFKTLLSMIVKVVAREYREVAEDDPLEEPDLMGRASSGRPKVATPRELVAMRLHYPDDITGELMEIRVLADHWRDHSWLESLPGHPDYDHRRAGLDQLQRAILAISDDVADEIIYRATGWRETEDGSWRYIHARGAITTDGHTDTEVALEGSLRRYDLPDPTNDVDAIRKAWLETSATLLQRLPGRVAAPLLGHAFRAALGHSEWSLALVGPPGSYKTSVAAKLMHHFGERWDHSKPAASMSGNGDTFNTLRYKLHHAKDSLYWMDDFAPTKSWAAAQSLLEETARLIHNQEERGRTSRDGQSINNGTPPRATGLFTSEVMPRPGSASERMLVVPLAKEDVDTAELFPLNEPESRHGRAVLMASFIQWLAHDLKNKRSHYQDVYQRYSKDLVETENETTRQSQAIASTWSGWIAITDFLTTVGAITEEERRVLLEGVDKSLREAGRAAVNPDMPRTTGARVRELLGYALRQGIAYVDDVKTGECPPWPLAGQLGWRRTVLETDQSGQAQRYRLDRNGIRLGYVLHDPEARERGRVLMCDSTQLEAALKAASATQSEKLEIDRNTACRALHEEGVLIPDKSEGRTRHTLKCRIYAEERYARMVTLWLDDILGDEIGGDDASTEGGPDDGGPDAGPNPRPPLPGVEGYPQTVDTATSSAHTEEAGPGDHTQQSETDHLGEEDSMTTAFVSRPISDADGVEGWTEPFKEESQPCVICGKPCVAVVAGARIHLPCWSRSTAAQRGQTPPEATSTTETQQPPRTTATAKTKPATKDFRAAAAVVDVDTIWLSNGEQIDMPGDGPKHVGDLVELAQWLRLGTQTTKYLNASGQLWVTAELAQHMGIDVAAIDEAPAMDKDKVAREVTKDSEVVSLAIEAGYNIGGRDGDCLGRWTRAWKGNAKSTWIVLMPAISRRDQAVELISGDPDNAALAKRIGLLAGALGQPYQLSGATTGLDLMTALRWKDRDTLFQVHEPCPPAAKSTVERDLSWCRKPTSEEQQHEWIHVYDRSGSYLAGVSGLELGVGEPIHHPEGTNFTPKTPGYWRIEIPEPSDWRMPNPLDPRGDTAGKLRWVTTPALEFAVELGYAPEIVEAYVWENHSRIFDPWYERVRDARTALDTNDPDAQVARDQLKQIYAPTIGMLGSDIHMKGRAGYAPDRRHMIIAKARTNILRRVAKIGTETDRWPVAIVTDSVLYTSSDPDPVAAWPGGERWMGKALGRYKVEGTATLESQLQYLTGGLYRGKEDIVDHSPGSE